MAVAQARVVSLHWEEKDVAIQEATVEVEHDNGDRQLFVVPILRMTDRLKGEMNAAQKQTRSGKKTTGLRKTTTIYGDGSKRSNAEINHLIDDMRILHTSIVLTPAYELLTPSQHRLQRSLLQRSAALERLAQKNPSTTKRSIKRSKRA